MSQNDDVLFTLERLKIEHEGSKELVGSPLNCDVMYYAEE